jgi:hypothetical protein
MKSMIFIFLMWMSLSFPDGSTLVTIFNNLSFKQVEYTKVVCCDAGYRVLIPYSYFSSGNGDQELTPKNFSSRTGIDIRLLSYSTQK